MKLELGDLDEANFVLNKTEEMNSEDFGADPDSSSKMPSDYDDDFDID